MNNLVQTIERVTPTMARKYLETSSGNRPISMPTVRTYAKAMKEGRWKMNGVPIVFDNEGHLLDGHHRLYAIIDANKSLEMSVTYGVESDTFTTFDCGRHRTIGQLLAMNGVSNYNRVSGVVSANAALENTGRIRQNNGAKGLSLANDVYYAKWSEHPEDYADCTKFAESLYRIARIMRVSWVGGLTFYLTHTGGYRVDFVKKFFSAVCNLETSGITPADELRKFILRNDRNNETKKITDEFLFAIVVKAWNAYARNKTVGMLKYVPSQEDYPALKLNV